MAHEVERIALIDIPVRVTLGHLLHVVEAAHPDDSVDPLRVAKAEAGRVIGAEARAGGDHERIRVAALGEGKQLVQEIRVVLQVAPRAGARMERLVVPALVMDLIDAVELDPAVLEVIPEHLVHPAVSPLVAVAHRRGEGEHSSARVAEDLDRHRPIESLAVPRYVLVMHGGGDS